MPFRQYVQAKVPETNNVEYDTQEQVYDAMFRMLEQAVDSIKPEDASQYKIDKDDICYFGDAEKWCRFANSMRLRMALRISNVNPERAKKEAEAALNNKYGLMKSNDDNMQTVPKHAPVEMGGEDGGGDENSLAMCSVAYGGESVLSKDMENLYRNLSDCGKEYTIKKGRNNSETKKIDPRCLVSWYRSNMTAATLATGPHLRAADLRRSGWYDRKYRRSGSHALAGRQPPSTDRQYAGSRTSSNRCRTGSSADCWCCKRSPLPARNNLRPAR